MSNAQIAAAESVNEFNEFQLKAKETAIFPEQHGLAYLSLGLFGEAGEVANKIKKFLRGDYDGKGTDAYNQAVSKIVDECGDTLWYLSQLLLLVNTKFGYICNCDDFDEYQSRLMERTSMVSVEHSCNELGRYVGKLCGCVAMAMVQTDKETENACLELIPSYAVDVIECLTVILNAYNCKLSQAAEACLAKLKTRKYNDTVRGDNRGD